MKWIKKFSVLLSLVLFMGLNSVFASTSNYPMSTNIEYWSWNYVGTTTPLVATEILRTQVPAKYKVLSVGACPVICDYTTGDENYSVDFRTGVTGTTTTSSILSSAISMGSTTTGLTTEGTLSTTTLNDESMLVVTVLGAGTTPIVTNITYWMTVQRQSSN